MEPRLRELLVDRLEHAAAIDRLAEPLQQRVRKAVPDGTLRREVLAGTWLGHPLHPLLTDVVVGSWSSAWMLDLLGGKRAAPAATRLVGIGCLAALPTAAAGLGDWSDVSGGARRIGVAHAAGNAAALALHLLSWRARRRGHRGRGILLAMLGAGAATWSAYLGGHLSYGKGVGVDQNVFESLPDDWVPAADESDLDEGKLVGVTAGDAEVLLVRFEGRVHAMVDRCAHRGCPLHEGEFRDGLVVCGCHGSAFRPDGTLVRGPATGPQPALEVRVEGGKVKVRTGRPA